MNDRYDYLIVGSGLYGSVCARRLTDNGHKVLVLEKRDHIGGNLYTENMEGINVHKYGAHIFHTDDKDVWDYVNGFVKFNDYRHQVQANYKGKIYDLPFNMNTFKQMWNIDTEEEARHIIDSQREDIIDPQNLEEQCISMVGKDIYKVLVKGYTEKQWGRDCKDLPSFIIKRLPLRFEYNNDYFNDEYQGIPEGGYIELIRGLLEGIEVQLNTDYLKDRERWNALTDRIIYTGPIDAYFNYCLGHLEYRSLRFEEEILNQEYYQDNSVVNYTDKEIPYTRIIEHKYFENSISDRTVITREYPKEWTIGDEPYYPINDEKNSRLYEEYRKLADREENVMFGGRLAEYRYYDMDEIVASVLSVL